MKHVDRSESLEAGGRHQAYRSFPGSRLELGPASVGQSTGLSAINRFCLSGKAAVRASSCYPCLQKRLEIARVEVDGLGSSAAAKNASRGRAIGQSSDARRRRTPGRCLEDQPCAGCGANGIGSRPQPAQRARGHQDHGRPRELSETTVVENFDLETGSCRRMAVTFRSRMQFRRQSRRGTSESPWRPWTAKFNFRTKERRVHHAIRGGVM